MKVAQSLRGVYDSLADSFSLLKKRVDSYVIENKNPRWHYESRLKGIESFAQKIESGRYSNPGGIDDFFACTIVVEHFGYVESAIKLISERFDFSHRRPKEDGFTHKHSYSFQFDDLRLYVSWKDSESSPPSGLGKLLFEVQIKTFLQHAWSIATHDMVYKSSALDWSKERIAYQIKALLEHAEVAISESSSLSQCSILQKEDKNTRRCNEILRMINATWSAEVLPLDTKTLSQNIDSLIRHVKVSPEALNSYLVAETSRGRGSRTLNLSPFGIVLQTLFYNDYEAVARYLLAENNDYKILIANEVDTMHLDRNACNNAIFLPRTFLP